ncbi:MAG: hypothetical protein O3B13_10010 [Planctomycetota bacterium]|nr:hypothetical protein [Planctomycetota bacterium]
MNNVRKFATCVLAVSLVCIFSDSVFAQPKPGYAPSSSHIFPAGGQRGTTVKVRVGAECIPPGTDFLATGEGLSTGGRLTEQVFAEGEKAPKREPTITPITYPREWASELTIDSEATLGPAYWRLNCAQGGTGSRPFLIGDLPEFIETESNSTIEKAERVRLPITLNGQIYGERDVDCFRFIAEAGQVISCEVIAGRIGSRLDPVVELLDSNGRKVDTELAHVGTDPILVFWSQSTAEYVLRVANVTFGGDLAHVYRINIRPEPFPLLVLPGGVTRAALAANDLRVVSLTGSRGESDEALGLIVPQQASDWNQWTVFEPHLGPLTLSIDDHPPGLEVEPNDDRSAPQAVDSPTVLYGQFRSATDRDCFRISAKKGERLRVEASAWPPGTPTLPVVSIVAPDGKLLKEARTVSSDDGVAEIVWTAKEDGDVLVQLQDLRHGSRGGLEFAWRLLIAPDESDFSLEAETDSLIVTQGQSSTIEVKARRHGEMNNAIELAFEGLPEGVTVEAAEIPKGKTSTKIKVTATQDVPSASFALRVVGKVTSGETTIERVAKFHHLGVDSEGVAVGSPTTETLHLSVQYKPLFRLFCEEAYLYAHRGSVFPYPMEVERLNGFDGLIRIQQGDRQNRDLDGVEIFDAEIKPGETTTILPIYLPETMAINVQSQSQLYSQAWATFTDPQGKEQSVLVLAEKRNMLRSMPPVVKLRSIDEFISAAEGETVSCGLRLQRTTNFDGPMKVELLSQFPEVCVEAGAAVFDAGKAETTIPVKVATSKTDSPVILRFRATGQLNDRVLITETTVTLIVK